MTGIPGKTGIVYTLDRETGEFLWATPTNYQNVISQIDGATGAVTVNPEVIFRELEQEVFVCPTWAGGKDWEAGAYSPLTHTMYYPLRNTCGQVLATSNFESDRARALTAGGQGGLAIYSLASRHQITPGTDNLGTVRAISVETGEATWLHEQRAYTMSLVATGGGLVFGGDANGRFRAFDDRTGGALAGQPGFVGERVPYHRLCRWPPICCGQHRSGLDQSDARAASQQGQQLVRIRTPEPRLNRCP